MPKKPKPVKEEPKQNETLELWKSRIATMKVYMENAANRKRWKEFKQFYLGKYTEALKLKKTVGIVVVNLVYAFVRTAVSDLFARNPKFKCNPKRKGSILKAKVGEQAINYFWYSKKTKRQVKKAIKEGKLVGYSWIKVGYEGELISFEESGTTSELVQNDDVFAVHVAHDAIWYDPGAQDPPYDCGWMIHTYMKPTEKLQEKYKNKDIKPTSNITYSGMTDKNNTLHPKDREMSRIYEIWDKENKKRLIYCDGYPDDFLAEKEWIKDMDWYPFCMLNFDTQTDLGEEDNLPEPEINAFIDQILEKMKFRSMQISHIKRFNRQIVVDKDKLDETEIIKMENSIDGAILKTQGDPSNVARTIEYAQIQPDIYAVENRIDMDYDRISGQPAFKQGGVTQTKTRTLGELEEMSSAVEGRQAEQQDIVEEFTEEIAKKVLFFMRKYYDKDRFARITGDVSILDKVAFQSEGMLDGATVRYKGENLPNNEDADIEVVAGSTLPLNPQTRLNHLVTLGRFGPAFGLAPSSVASLYLGQQIMEELELKDVAKAFDVDIKRLLTPKQPTPKEQLDMIDRKQKIDKNATDIRLKQSRVEGNQLSNLGKALKNANEMEGNGENDMQQMREPGSQTRKD